MTNQLPWDGPTYTCSQCKQPQNKVMAFRLADVEGAFCSSECVAVWLHAAPPEGDGGSDG